MHKDDDDDGLVMRKLSVLQLQLYIAIADVRLWL